MIILLALGCLTIGVLVGWRLGSRHESLERDLALVQRYQRGQ